MEEERDPEELIADTLRSLKSAGGKIVTGYDVFGDQWISVVPDSWKHLQLPKESDDLNAREAHDTRTQDKSKKD